jgi:DamX protein
MNIQSSPIESDAGGQDSWIDDRLPHPSSFFPGTAYNDILERVHRLAEDAEDIALLTGVQGAGKTTLLYRIQSDIPEHWVLCRLDANPMLHPDQLLNRLARCIDFPPRDEGLVESVAAAFCKLRLQGRLPVVMVDDAEQLPISSLMALLRLHEQRAATTPACALILFAQPNIDRTLASHQLHAMGTARFVRLELPRLAYDEIGEYVRHFLGMEGVEQEFGFSPEQLAALHSESGGLPGKVNELVNRTLRDAIVPRRDPLPAQFVRWLRRIPPATALASGAVALFLLLTLLFQQQIDSLFQEPAPTVASLPEPSRDLRHAEPIREPEERRVQPLRLRPFAGRLDREAEPLPRAPLPESGTRYETEESAPTAENAEPEEVQAVTREPVRPATPRPPEAAPPVSEPTKPLSKQAANPKPVQPATPRPPKAALPVSAPPKPVSKAAATPKPVQSEPIAAAPRFKREAWLLRQRPEAYSLQILAAGNEESVRRFARKHRLTTDVYYFKSQRNGRPWIALLLGIYTDRETAVTVLNMLPDSLRKAGAWPRSLASIQEEIKKVR